MGRWVEKYRLPIGGDNIVIVLLKFEGLQADSVLNNYQFLGDLLDPATGNVECDFTHYMRPVLSSVDITVLPNITTGVTTVDTADQTWLSAGGAVNNRIGAILSCYRQTSVTPDSQMLLLTKHDSDETTSGVDLKLTIPSIGTARWSAT